jgi:hypothetical protein
VVKVENAQSTSQDVQVVGTAQSFTIFRQDFPLVLASLVRPETVLLRLDLRPLGINIFDDFAGLHIGANVFVRNEVRNAAIAINLGD